MLYKLRSNRRHKFEKVKFKITHWFQYNQSLKDRGSITLWLYWKLLKHGIQKSTSKNYKVANLNIQTLQFR